MVDQIGATGRPLLGQYRLGEPTNSKVLAAGVLDLEKGDSLRIHPEGKKRLVVELVDRSGSGQR